MNPLAAKAPRAFATALAVIAALAVALGALLAPVGAARAADDDLSWTVRTADNPLGSARTSYRYTVAPGSTVRDSMVVANHGTAALELGVYTADGYTTTSGQLDLLLDGAKSTGIGRWAKTDAPTLSIAPGESAEIPFTLSVPKNATPGDYAGGIVTSFVHPDEAEQINVDRRLGIRISLRVSGDLEPGIAIEGMKLHWDGGLNPFAGGDATLSYTVHNTGNAVLSARQATAVTGPFGWFPVKPAVVEDTPKLLPGERWKVTVPVHDAPAVFRLAATATVMPIVVDASGSTTALAAVTADAGGWAVPWMLLILLFVVAALVVFGVIFWRRRRAQQKEREDARVREAVELALAGTAASASEQD